MQSQSYLDHQSVQSLLRRLWRHISLRRRLQFFILIMLMVTVSFVEIVSIGAVFPFLGVLMSPQSVFDHPLAQPLINALKITNAQQLLLPITIAFALASIFSGVLRLVLLWAQTRLSHAVGADLSLSIYQRTLYQPYAIHVARNSSEVISGISTKAHVVVYHIILPVLTILSSGLMLIVIIGALVAIEPRIAFGVFAGFGGIYLTVILTTKKTLLRNSQRISRESSRVIKVLQEGLGGIRDILIDGTQSTYCEIYRNADLPFRRAQASVEFISGSPRFIIEALGVALIAGLAYLLANRSQGILAALPLLGALALGAQRLLPVLQQAYASWSSLRGGQASMCDAMDLLDQPMPEHLESPKRGKVDFSREIRLQEISFRYTDDSPWVLHSINLTILKGARVGLIGSTGSGKSSLLDLIMCLLLPTKGSINIDDQVINIENQRAWQEHIAHVPQAIFLSDASIAENIAFGVRPDKINFELVRRAAEQAQISTLIEGWSKKYYTSVGERGLRLSGGQRQRIGIARALYKQANVIVFDEATSALDNETEHAVIEAISKIGRHITIIMVAHRLTTLKGCDYIVELEGGKVKRVGSYQDIVNKGVKSGK